MARPNKAESDREVAVETKLASLREQRRLAAGGPTFKLLFCKTCKRCTQHRKFYTSSSGLHYLCETCCPTVE